MNLKDHHTKQELQTLYRTEKDARLARRLNKQVTSMKNSSEAFLYEAKPKNRL